MSKIITRISERYISPMNEFKVKELMQTVEEKLKKHKVKGLYKYETLVDRQDPNRYVVITQWKTRKDLNAWLASDLCKDIIKLLDPVLAKKATYREFVRHGDGAFLCLSSYYTAKLLIS